MPEKCRRVLALVQKDTREALGRHGQNWYCIEIEVLKKKRWEHGKTATRPGKFDEGLAKAEAASDEKPREEGREAEGRSGADEAEETAEELNCADRAGGSVGIQPY